MWSNREDADNAPVELGEEFRRQSLRTSQKGEYGARGGGLKKKGVAAQSHVELSHFCKKDKGGANLVGTCVATRKGRERREKKRLLGRIRNLGGGRRDFPNNRPSATGRGKKYWLRKVGGGVKEWGV